MHLCITERIPRRACAHSDPAVVCGTIAKLPRCRRTTLWRYVPDVCHVWPCRVWVAAMSYRSAGQRRDPCRAIGCLLHSTRGLRGRLARSARPRSRRALCVPRAACCARCASCAFPHLPIAAQLCTCTAAGASWCAVRAPGLGSDGEVGAPRVPGHATDGMFVTYCFACALLDRKPLAHAARSQVKSVSEFDGYSELKKEDQVSGWAYHLLDGPGPLTCGCCRVPRSPLLRTSACVPCAARRSATRLLPMAKARRQTWRRNTRSSR